MLGGILRDSHQSGEANGRPWAQPMRRTERTDDVSSALVRSLTVQERDA